MDIKEIIKKFTKSIMAKRYIRFYEILLILVGLFLVFRNQWVCDDGYIYFRYIDNLVVHKIGLVFNKGDFVEGFTSPLWVMVLSILRFFLPYVSLRHMVFILGWIISAISFFILASLNNMVLKEERKQGGIDKFKISLNFSLPLVLAVSTQVIPEFFTSGLETPLVMLYSVLVAAQILIPSNNIFYVGLLIGAGPLIRPEISIFSVLILIHYFFILKRKGLLKAIIIGALPNVCYLIFRIWYYAALLPNTYYAKASEGAYFRQGINYLKDLIQAYPVHVLLGAVIFLLLIQVFSEKGRKMIVKNRIFLIFSILVYSSYVIWVGGDFMHGRFWLPALMLLYAGFSGLIEPFFSRVNSKFSPKKISLINISIIVMVMIVMMSSKPIQEGKEIINGIADERDWYLKSNEDHLSEWNFEPQNDWAETGKILNKLSKSINSDITMAHGNVGYLGYYSGPNVTIIDLLGLTDPVVSRVKLEKRGRPGHEKSVPSPYILWKKAMMWKTPFEVYNSNFKLIPGMFPITNFDPRFLDSIGRLYNRDIHDEIEEAVKKLLADRDLNPNLLFLLKTVYAPYASEKLQKEISNKYEKNDKGKWWEAWLEEHKEDLEIIEAQRHNKHNFFENMVLAIKAHKIRLK